MTGYQKYYVGQTNPLVPEYSRAEDVTDSKINIGIIVNQLTEKLELSPSESAQVYNYLEPGMGSKVKYLNVISNNHQFVMTIIIQRITCKSNVRTLKQHYGTEFEVYTLSTNHTQLFHGDEARGDLIVRLLAESRIVL